MFKSIDHIEISTLNIEESLEFYTEILGFKIKSRRKPQMSVSSLGKSGATELAYLTLGNTTLELLEFPDAEPIPNHPHIGYRMMALSVDDMDVAIDHLRKHEVTISREPVRIGDSMRGEFKDNNGVTIEIRKW